MQNCFPTTYLSRPQREGRRGRETAYPSPVANTLEETKACWQLAEHKGECPQHVPPPIPEAWRKQGGRLNTMQCGLQNDDSVSSGSNTFSTGTVWSPADSKNQVGPLLAVMIPGLRMEAKGQQNSVTEKYCTLRAPQLRDITPQQKPN